MASTRSHLLREIRKRLRAAVIDLERVQSARVPSEPADEGACEPWADGRLTPIDRFESQGRRYIVASEAPAVSQELSPREREVVTRAVAGASNKEIARELGLAHATVKVMLHRAATKVKARTRDELIAIFRGDERMGP